jgi:hypothetical protein
MVPRRILLALVAVLALSACERGPQPDALSQRLLDRYDIQPVDSTTTQRMKVGARAEEGMPWEEYLGASRRIGLDFSDHFGESAEVRTTPIEGAPSMRLHVLVLDGGQAIGAWLSGEDDATGGSAIYSLDDPP